MSEEISLKTTIGLGLCVLMMCLGSSVSWTKQPARAAAKEAAKKAKKPKKAQKKPTPSASRRKPGDAPSARAKAASRPAASRPAQPLSPQRKALQELLKRGIAQLKAKKYKAFLKRFISPGDKSRIFSRMSLKALAPRFGRHKAPILLAALSWSLSRAPTFAADNQKATFSLKGMKTPTPKQQLIFVKVKGTWYIKD